MTKGLPNAIGRIRIADLKPEVDGGLFPAKAYQGEVIPFGATVFREGHDAVGAELILVSPSGKTTKKRLEENFSGSDFFETRVQIDEIGTWSYQVLGFGDDFATWHHNATVKIAIAQDTDLVILEALSLFSNASKEKNRSKHSLALIKQLILIFEDVSISAKAKLAAVDKPEMLSMFKLEPVRSLETLSASREVLAERKLAGCGSWYEFFPRSEGASKNADGSITSGNFSTATKSLQRVKNMGFEVLYLPPIHPIGSAFKKGANNSLTALDSDPGSPWAIGSQAGGHDVIHPDLGNEKDFAAFVKAANKLSIEIAMDFALQASPDHPWVKKHPEWFTTRADGSIAYAENPPKKYQDIYPINFDNDPEGIYQESLRILLKWIGLGVKIFRVDNPHTKPVNFWQRLIAEVNLKDPEVIFLAEAFTRPAIMHTLGKAGFQQSYTYFTWRNTKQELESYLSELSFQTDSFFRPNLWVTTPDILTPYLQYGGPAAHRIRAALAATMAPSFGVYAGYELYEAVARPGVDEHIDSEKYQYKIRDFQAAEKNGKSLAPYLKKLNEIRASQPALGQLRNVSIHYSDDSEILVFAKHLEAEFAGGKPNTVIVVANLDPHAARETNIHLELWKLGLEDHSPFKVRDLITGVEFTWGKSNFVRLDSFSEPVHILEVIR
ncbi:MAG: maltotransferase domain-containing protein [Rhodoluna sp.]